ncbi:hypothetical protein EDF56_1157 [Novosphingobium sp. PhB165]|nr:hypothetical protein EDF56_1157 [Novosphingobium sp. PhB165]
MPRYTVVPVNPVDLGAEIISGDAGVVLGLVHRLGCGEVDVLRNNSYLFSVELNEHGFWSIFSRSKKKRSSEC